MSIAEERIDRPRTLAREVASDYDHSRARKYARLTCYVVEWNRCGPPRVFRQLSCDDCDAYLRPDVNVRVRIRASGHVVVRCDCGATKRCPYWPSDSDFGGTGPFSRVYDNQTAAKALLLKPSST